MFLLSFVFFTLGNIFTKKPKNVYHRLHVAFGIHMLYNCVINNFFDKQKINVVTRIHGCILERKIIVKYY